MNRPLFLISLAGFFYAIGNGIIWFILPNFIKINLTSDLVLISLLIAVPSVTSLIFDIPVGSLSDHTGRKKVLISGLILLPLLGPVLLYANSMLALMLFAALFGILNALVLPVARAFIMDICPTNKAAQYFGMSLALMSLGAAMGPLLSGFLIEGSFNVGLADAILLYMATTLLAIVPLLFVNETLKDRKTLLQGVKKVLENGVFLPAVKEFKTLKKMGLVVIYVTVILTLIDGIIWTYGPLFYGEKGLSAGFGGTLLFIFMISLVLFQPLGGFLADKFGKLRVLKLGLLIGGIFLVIFALQNEEIPLMITALCSSIGLSLAWPAVSGVITEISASRKRGSVAGVWTLFFDVAYLGGPMAGGLIAAFSGDVSSIFFVMGLVLVISTFPLGFITRQK